MMSLVLRLYSQLLEHPSQLWEGITSFLRSFHRHLGILDGLVYWSSLLSKVLMKRMFPEEVRGLYIATFLAEVCLDFIWVIVQLRCILEVIKEEKFCTSFSLKEFNVAINTFLGLLYMLAVESLFQVDIVRLILAFLFVVKVNHAVYMIVTLFNGILVVQILLLGIICLFSLLECYFKSSEQKLFQ